MGTVFSHIIQKRYSKSFEDIASDALVYILKESVSARIGMVNFLRSIVPTMPDLSFQSQLSKENARPDIWGKSDDKTWVYIENKFWAGLTENQPVTYLRQLSELENETLLLFVVPGMREQSMRGELTRRLKLAEIGFKERDQLPTGVTWVVDIQIGTTLALTSWQRLIDILEFSARDEKETIDNLYQLKSLCKVADNSAFMPFNEKDLNDQNIPAILLQLGQIILDSIEKAKNRSILNLGGLTLGKSFESFGKYARFNNAKGVGFLLCVDYNLWKKTGRSPLWIKIPDSEFGQAQKVKPLLEEWNKNNDILVEPYNDGIGIAIDIPPHADKDGVMEEIVRQIKQLADILIDIRRIE